MNKLSERRLQLPWLLPGLRRPNFVFYRIKVSIPRRIPPTLIYALIYLSILYIFSGGVYNLVKDPFARGADQQGNPVLIFTDQDRQFAIEGYVAGIVMFLGAAGLYFLSQATADPHNPDRATSYQTIGVVMIIVAFLILQSMYNCKVTGKCG